MSLVFPELTQVKLVNVNARSEQHGPDLVPAIDLRFSREMSATVLTLLHPELKSLIYADAKQGSLLGADEVQDGSELRFPKLAAPFVWKEEVEGCSVFVDFGTDAVPGIAFGEAKLHKQTFEAKEGGTVKVSFTVSCVHSLSAEPVGRLCLNVQHEVRVKLMAPEPVAEDA